MNKILIIEDELDIANLEREILIHSGYEVVVKTDGMDGYIEFMQGNYDIVVTDIMMPVMDGKKLIDLIRGVNSEVAIIVVSALDDEYTKKRLQNLGANDYLAKPFSLSELVDIVKENIK